MPDPTFTTRQINGHWHLIIKTGTTEEAYPAASETGASIMLRMEQRRRGLLLDGGPGTPTKNPVSRS